MEKDVRRLLKSMLENTNYEEFMQREIPQKEQEPNLYPSIIGGFDCRILYEVVDNNKIRRRVEFKALNGKNPDNLSEEGLRRLKLRQDELVDEIEVDKQIQMIVRGLGGRDNFSDLDCCITRLRAAIVNTDLVSESLLKQAGAAAIVLQGNNIQIIYGPKASSVKVRLEEYLQNIPPEYDELPVKENMGRCFRSGIRL